MDIISLKLTLIFLISSLIGIESILDQFQFHRPLLACTLMGIILGDLKTGIIIGGTLEIMSLGWINIGAAICPDSALASIISTLLVIIGKQSIGSGITLAIPIAAAGQILTIIVRSICISIQHLADKIIENNKNTIYLSYLHLIALTIQALRVSIPVIIFCYSMKTETIKNLLDMIPAFITEGLNVSGNIIVTIGYAMVINMIKEKYLMPFFYLGFIISGSTSFNLLSLGIIGIILSILYIQLSPKYYDYKNIKYNKNNKKNIKDDELD